MANLVSRADMRARVRRLAGMETPAAGTPAFCSDTEINGWINDAIRELYDKLIFARGEDYYATYHDQTMTVGGPTYYICGAPTMGTPLQIFYRMTEVVVFDTSSAVRVPRYQASEYARQVDINLHGNASDKGQLRWKFAADDKILFVPTPGTAWTLRCYYIPAFQDLTADSGTGGIFDGINGFEDWVCFTCAIRCLSKEESDCSALLALRADIDARISRMAGRDDTEPMRIADTNPDRFTWSGRSKWDRTW